MPYSDDFTVAEQEQLFRELQQIDSKRQQFRAEARPDVAAIVSQLAQYAPHADPNIIEPASRAVANGQMPMELAQNTLLESQKIVLQDPTTEEEDKPEGGFLSRLQDSALDLVKGGSRWTFAAANLVPQLVTNVGSRVVGATIGSDDQPGGVYERPETGFFDGWFASTDLGSMLSGRDYGEGFFIGEEALEYQREQAKRYRGTVGGQGWTFGRGTASTMFQPGTREYSILSGLVDAGAALATPSIPFASQIGRGVRATRQAAGIGRRSAAGLADFGNAQILASRVPRWLDSEDGQKVIRYLANDVDDIEKAYNTFENAPNQFLLDVVGETSETGIRNILESNLGTQGLAATSDINLRAAGTKMSKLNDKWGFRSVRRTRERLGAGVAPGEIVLDFSDEFAQNDSVRRVLDVMKTLRVDRYTKLDGSTIERRDLLERVARVVSLENPEDFRNVVDEIDEMIAFGVANTTRVRGRRKLMRAAEEVAEETGEEIGTLQEASLAIMRRYRQQQESHLFGAIAPDGSSNGFLLATADDLADADADAVDNLLEGVIHTPDGTEATGVFMGPLETAATLGEMRRYAASLPDIRALRRETSRLAFLFSKGFRDANSNFGDPQKWITMLDFAQNRVWKSGTLMTGGYAIRNISESMVRSAMAPGIRTGPAHPIEWILAMTKRRGFGSIDGLRWTDEALSNEAGRLMREYAQTTGATMREALDAASLQYKAYQTGAWAIAPAAGDRSLYRQGLQDQIHLLAEDPIIRQIAQGKTNDEIIDFLRNTDEGRAAARAQQARWTNKRPAGADSNVRVTYDFVNSKGELNESNWNKVLDLYYRERLRYETGNSPELRNIIATIDRGGEFTGPNGETFKAFRQGELGGGQALPGVPELLGYDPAFARLINRLIDDDVTSLPQTVKYRVHAKARGTAFGSPASNELAQGLNRTVQHFFTNVFGKKEAFINRSPAFRQFYYSQVRNLLPRMEADEAKKIIENVKDAYLDEVGEVYKTLRAVVPEDGVYRVGADVLDEAAYKARLAEAKKARDLKMEGFNDQWARRYLGGGKISERITGKSLWDELNEQAARTSPVGGATFTADQVSLAARGYAAEETKKLFYNAADTSNLADIMRIVSPFGQAWAEVMKAWYKQVLINPNRLKNMGVSFRGVRDMDPDGDGKGFLYTDPVTGEMMFNYPFVPGMASVFFGAAGGLASQTLLGRTPLGMAGSGLLGVGVGAGVGAKLGADVEEAGLDTTLAAPIKSANMALNVLPSVGPVMQIAANRILPDKPQFDDIREFLLPYGAAEFTPAGVARELVPSWAQKMIDAIQADPDNDRLFGDMYIDAYRALYATGEFDRTSQESMNELDERARSTARKLLMLRAIGQFVGPARPGVVLNVPTKYEGEIGISDVEMMDIEGNIPNNMLSKAYRYFQDEDFDTAVVRFLDTFGDETMLYVVGSTTSISRGLDASKEFGDWERQNGEFRERNRDVYGYFANVGSQFDFETYIRLIRIGDMEKRSDGSELREDAEAVVGRAMYRELTRQFGAKPSKAQERAARTYKLYLQDALPGYAIAPFNVNEREEIIKRLQDAAYDPLVADNDVARAARMYFEERERAIGIANSRREQPALSNPLSGEKNADLRAYLRYVGETLVGRNPDFDRMFSRELFSEIDVDA